MNPETEATEPTHAAAVAEFATDNALYRFLEGSLFKGIIGYTVDPIHILALLVLWIGLLLWHNTIFELVGGNYTTR